MACRKDGKIVKFLTILKVHVSLLDCYAAETAKWIPVFQRKTQPPSGLKAAGNFPLKSLSQHMTVKHKEWAD